MCIITFIKKMLGMDKNKREITKKKEKGEYAMILKTPLVGTPKKIWKRHIQDIAKQTRRNQQRLGIYKRRGV